MNNRNEGQGIDFNLLATYLKTELSKKTKQLEEAAANLPVFTEEQTLSHENKFNQLKSYMQEHQISDKKLVEFCSLTAEKIQQLSFNEATAYMVYIQDINKAFSMIWEVFRSAESKASDTKVEEYIKNHANGICIKQLQDLANHVKKCNMPNIVDESKFPHFFLLQEWAKLYLSIKQYHTKLEINKNILAEHTVNLLGNNSINVEETLNDEQYLQEVTNNSSVALALKEKYHLDFKAWLREGYYVDCLLKDNTNDDLFLMKNDFYQNDIKTHHTFFKGVNHLIIPNVNVKEVSDKIYCLVK